MQAVMLQARMDSSRLPGKAMLPLGKKPLLLRVMEALLKIPADKHILVCTEDSVKDFEPLAREAGFLLFAGPKEDVLARFCLAMQKYRIRHCIRATGDNPFVFADAATSINAQAKILGADYAGYSGIPIGAGVESVNAKALFRAETETSSPYDREHVCPYLYNNPQLFLLHRPLAPLHWQNPRITLTVDTQEDYEMAQALYATLDRLEESGEQPSGSRYYGQAIIKAYQIMNGKIRDGE